MQKCKKSDVIIWSGKTLREWRKNIGWTQAELAKEFGVSRPTIVSWEKEPEYIPRLVYLAVMALKLDAGLIGTSTAREKQSKSEQPNEST